jgi:pimeloyl-ACP methyl ester carboxylesterase
VCHSGNNFAAGKTKTMTEKYFTYNSSKIFYRVTGSGKPVVLIHGFGEDGNIWHNQIAALEKNYTLIIPDLPGSGQSELIADMSIEGMAECVKTIFGTENLNQPVILGHSMGGYITLALAEKYPQLVNTFGLIHSSAYADSEKKKETRRKAIEFIKATGAYEFLKTAIPGLFLLGQDGSRPSDPLTAAQMNHLIEAGKNFTPKALIAYYTAMINRPDRTAVLKTFTQPILFLMGLYDKAVPFEHSLAQSHLPQQSHIHILRNSAHMGMVEEAEETTAALLEFLNAAK